MFSPTEYFFCPIEDQFLSPLEIVFCPIEDLLLNPIEDQLQTGFFYSRKGGGFHPNFACRLQNNLQIVVESTIRWTSSAPSPLAT